MELQSKMPGFTIQRFLLLQKLHIRQCFSSLPPQKKILHVYWLQSLDLFLPFSGFVLVPPLDLSGATPWICCGLVLADIYRHSDQGIVRPGDERFLWQSRNSGKFSRKAITIDN